MTEGMIPGEETTRRREEHRRDEPRRDDYRRDDLKRDDPKRDDYVRKERDYDRNFDARNDGPGKRDDYSARRDDRDRDRTRDERAGSSFDRNDRQSTDRGEASGAPRKDLLRDPVADPNSDKSPDTIYISNLPKSVTEASLARFFGAVGIIKKDKKTFEPKVWIYKDKSTGAPKGDATVTYEDPSASDGAILWFDGKPFEGNNLKVEKAQAPKPPPGGWNQRRRRF
ncbi:hypothetical protein HDU91_007227 [Kappamyces sp. JEL0680]|nr:hypothetical protein HDU91_007227 [Kappamyces sp. JEL0680]